MQADRYGLQFSTASQAARDAYMEGVDLFLSANFGSEAAFGRAIAHDPAFALAHAALGRTLQLYAKPAAAKAAVTRARELAGKLPRIGLRKIEAKPLGDSVYDVTIQVENTGYLPTALAHGALTREVLFTRVVLKLEDKQILSGQKKTMFGPIEGSGGMKEVRYIIHAKDRKKIEFEVISMLGGTLQGSIEIKEGK